MRKMKKKNINLYEQYMKTVEKGNKKKISPKTIRLLGAAAGLAVLVGVYLIFWMQLNTVKDTYDDLYDKIYSDSAAEQAVSVERLKYENQILQMINEKYQQNITKIDKQNSETEMLSEDLIVKILGCQSDDTRIRNISYDKGIVFISGEANDVINASGFVSRLDETGIFSYISYTGYTRQGNVYAFSATGYFNGNESSENGGY